MIPIVMGHPAIPSLPKNDHSNHGNNDHDRSHDQPVSHGFSLPRRLHSLLVLLVCGSLCCPSGLFFLSGFFLTFRHGLLLCHGGCGRLWLLQSEIIPLLTHHHRDSARGKEVCRNGVRQAVALALLPRQSWLLPTRPYYLIGMRQ